MSDESMSEAVKDEFQASVTDAEGAEDLAAFEAELDAGVDALMADSGDQGEDDQGAEGEGAAGEPADAQEPKGEEAPKDEKAPKEKAPALSEAAIERAVRAGLSMAEAKQFSSDALLSAVCDRIEGAGGLKKAGDQDGAGDDVRGGEVDPANVEGLLEAIPDLNPDDYDEELVAGFKSLKAIIRQQASSIEELRGSRQSQDWLSTKLESVREFTKGDAEKSAAVREKFDVLRAGYKAAGKDVADDSVFEEAARLVLGGDMEAARLENKGRAAEKRSGQRIQRVGVRKAGKVQQSTDPDDVLAEIGAELDAQFDFS